MLTFVVRLGRNVWTLCRSCLVDARAKHEAQGFGPLKAQPQIGGECQLCRVKQTASAPRKGGGGCDA